MRLAVIWLIGAGLALALLMSQTVGGTFGQQFPKAWSWLLPMVMPTLSLIVASVAYDLARGRGGTVGRISYVVVAAVSCFYLLLIMVSLVIASQVTSPLDALVMSNLWLAPIQGLVGIAMAAFFKSHQRT
jgi:hypothetical protein